MTIFVLLTAVANLLFGGIIPAAFLSSEAVIKADPSVWLAVSLIAVTEAVLAASVLHKTGDVA